MKLLANWTWQYCSETDSQSGHADQGSYGKGHTRECQNKQRGGKRQIRGGDCPALDYDSDANKQPGCGKHQTGKYVAGISSAKVAHDRENQQTGGSSRQCKQRSAGDGPEGSFVAAIAVLFRGYKFR